MRRALTAALGLLVVVGVVSAQINVTSSFQTLAGGVDVVSGHFKASGTAPALSACGAAPSIVGSDSAGKVTVGTVATTCTLTFATPFTTAPACTISVNNAIDTVVTTTTSTLVFSGTDISSFVVSYICIEGS